MQLRCKVCGATQQVSCPDEADEDLRTQSIRRAFRAEHVACGERTVTLETPNGINGVLETDAVLAWADSIDHPADVVPQIDGTFVRAITRDGVLHNVNVCEGCWNNIPRYVDFPFGLVSPDSDGDAAGTGAKIRRISMDTNTPSAGVEHLRKVVCLPCYLAAFHRVYPNAPLPELCDDVVGDGLPIAPPLMPAEDFASDPMRQAVA